MEEGGNEATETAEPGWTSKHHRQRPRKSKLYSDIRSQMEFYFSDANLTKQRVMRDIVQESEFVSLSIFVEKFNKLSQLTKNVEDVRRALKKSEKLQLSEDGTGVKRKIPFDNTKTKDEATVENCTIYVENIPLDVDHAWIDKIFQEFGQVAYVSLPKFKRSKQPKGFAFVEFEDEEAAKRCLEAFGEMGGCLPTNIEPSALMSISTFKEDEYHSAEKPKLINSRKRARGKETMEEQEVDEKRSKVSETEAKYKEEPITSTSPSTAPIPKLKSNKLQISTTAAKASSISIDNAKPQANSETDGGNEAKTGKKKKRRRQSIPGRDEKLESDLIHLKILPKRNWRQLRNRYLNLQRENFGKLKAQLRNSFVPQQTSTGQYKSVCVQIQLETPASRENVVATITSELAPPDWFNFVKYIDYDDNSTEAIVRLDGGPSAGPAIFEFIETANRFYKHAKIMSGLETDEYWAKSRAKLKEQKKAKVRGKDQLLNRAAKLTSSHIHFDNDETEIAPTIQCTNQSQA